MPTNLAAPPLQDPIVHLERAPGSVPGVMTRVFENWLRALAGRTQAAAYAVKAIALESQSASIGLTSLIASAAGLYRVSYRFRVRTAAGVSSSIQFHVTTTEGAITCVQESAAYTGNVTNRPQSGAFLVRADAASPLSYSTTYASSPAAAMLYDLDVSVEQL